MDLRPYLRNKPELLDKGVKLIKSNHLFYQPFILSDDIEVGEGRNMCESYADVDSVFDLNVYAPNLDLGSRKKAQNLPQFRRYNEEYRSIYNYITNVICKQFSGDISNLSFAEIGTNTGLNLFNLALKGAKKCYGYDWNDMRPIFDWLNEVLGLNVEFTQCNYNNLFHRFDNNIDVPEVDVMINTVFTNHQCDPLQFLCYICDRASKGVFLWILTDTDVDSCAIYYPDEPPHDILDTQRSFPLYFNNGVCVTEKLLRLSLKRLGFGSCERIESLVPSDKWSNFQAGFIMYYAKRTSDIKSSYWAASQAPMSKKNNLWQKITGQFVA